MESKVKGLRGSLGDGEVVRRRDVKARKFLMFNNSIWVPKNSSEAASNDRRMFVVRDGIVWVPQKNKTASAKEWRPKRIPVTVKSITRPPTVKRIPEVGGPHWNNVPI